MARKFLVRDNYLVMGNVQYHNELLPKIPHDSIIAGGGMWDLNMEKEICYFWGVSTEFGQVGEDIFRAAVKNSHIQLAIANFTLLFSTSPFNDRFPPDREGTWIEIEK